MFAMQSRILRRNITPQLVTSRDPNLPALIVPRTSAAHRGLSLVIWQIAKSSPAPPLPTLTVSLVATIDWRGGAAVPVSN